MKEFKNKDKKQKSKGEVNNLRTINFEGTIAEWNAISKGDDWKIGCGTITVYCTNGTVTM